MTKEETKKLVEVIQAYINGKEIEVQNTSGEWRVITSPEWHSDRKYRIKPKYRPFRNNIECIKEMQKHLPFGWIKDIRDNDKCFYFITEVCGDSCCYGGDDEDGSYVLLFEFKKFLDGEPFGIKE